MDRTNAERQRRYIAKLKAAAQSQAGVTNAAEIARLKARIAELEADARAQADIIAGFRDIERKIAALKAAGVPI